MENKVFENTTMKHKTRVAEPLDGEPLLEVSRLSANIGQFRILEEVSFAAHKNEITVILGRNGAGKTTTLRTLMGYIGANGGSVHFQGRALTGLFTHQIQRLGIGYVPEDDNVFSNLTVEENLRLSIRERKPSHSEALERALTTFPDLKVAWKRSAGTLSGGQKQMLAVASVLVAEPVLMLIDEPSKGLSPLFVERLGDVLEGLRGTTSVVLVEQNFYLASRVGDRFVLLDDGQSVLAGEMKQLVESADLQQRYLGIRVASGEG